MKETIPTKINNEKILCLRIYRVDPHSSNLIDIVIFTKQNLYWYRDYIESFKKTKINIKNIEDKTFYTKLKLTDITEITIIEEAFNNLIIFSSKNFKETTLKVDSANLVDCIVIIKHFLKVPVKFIEKTKWQELLPFIIFGGGFILIGLLLAAASIHYHSGGRLKMKGNILTIIIESLALTDIPAWILLIIFASIGIIIIALGFSLVFLFKKKE